MQENTVIAIGIFAALILGVLVVSCERDTELARTKAFQEIGKVYAEKGYVKDGLGHWRKP